MPEGAEVAELHRRGLDAHSLAGGRPLREGNCHGPLPIITLGKRELTFQPHSIQDLEAMGDVGLLWDARHPPGSTGSENQEPRNPTPGDPQPQPCQPDAECIRNLKPRLDPQPLTRSQANRLEKPRATKTPLALGNGDPRGQP